MAWMYQKSSVREIAEASLSEFARRLYVIALISAMVELVARHRTWVGEVLRHLR
jgi:hypothetical protein